MALVDTKCQPGLLSWVFSVELRRPFRCPELSMFGL